MVGISLDEVGIDITSTYVPEQTQLDRGFPKAYDFALHLQLNGGSWRQMRDVLHPIAVSAFRGREVPLLGFTLH